MEFARIETTAYWLVFVAAFLGVAIWESSGPKSALHDRAERRWMKHGVLLALSMGLAGLILRITPVYYALALAGKAHGLLNQSWMPGPVSFLLGWLALDFTNYAVHRLMHSVGFLWRVHEVHHSDHDFDVSTAARFHPIEVVLMQGAKLVVIRLLVAPVAAVFVAELAVVAENFFAHSNCSLPLGVERWLRLFVITPDVHRLHHSAEPRDFNRNFGQLFPWWDRLLGTWGSLPAGAVIETGVRGLPEADPLRIGYMLAEPFQRRPKGLPILPPSEEQNRTSEQGVGGGVR